MRSSGNYRSYNAEVPSFLRNRPRKLVKHCIKRIGETTNIQASSICRKGDLFTVLSSSSSEIYTIKFGTERDFPKCTCHDFLHNFLPCKHMFAIFNKYADVGWHSLPDWYSNSVYMVLDPVVVNKLSAETVCDTVVKTQDIKNSSTNQSISQPENIVTDDKTCGTDNKTSDRKQSHQKFIDLMKHLIDLSYDVSSKQVLDEGISDGNAMVAKFSKACSYDSGFRITQPPELKSLKRKRKTTPSENTVHDELPRKRPKPNPFSSRVGQFANLMQPLHQVTTLFPRSKKSVKLTTPQAAKACDQHESSGEACMDIVRNKHSMMQKNITAHVTGYKASGTILKNGPHSISLLELKSLDDALPLTATCGD